MKENVLLQMSIKDNIIPHIRDYKTFKETWDVLKGLYETANTNRVLTLKGLVQDYKVFISTLSTRPKPPTFDGFIGIHLQEEERMKNYDLDSHSLYLAFITNGKKTYIGKPWDKYRGMF